MTQAPTTIGPYEVIRRLANGGMGEVFLAFDPRLERQVAIKRIGAEGDGDPTCRARFRREGRLAAGLNHPSIVQVFDLLNEGDVDYIVMEYVSGTSLREALKKGPLPLDQGLAIAVSIAEGLAYAHRQDIVHRDLKTENVLLTSGGEAKIVDFGIARRLLEKPGEESLTREGCVLGTCRTMAPEQASGEPSGPRSDLFSFGVLLYELFTGSSPFLAKTEATTSQRILDPKYRPRPACELVPELPKELSALIDQLLEKIPVFRPRDAEEVLHRLRALSNGANGEREVTATLEATLPDRPRITAPNPAGGGSALARTAWISILVGMVLGAGLLLLLWVKPLQEVAAPKPDPRPYLIFAEREVSEFSRTHDPAQRRRAFTLVEEAETIAPDHPEICFTRVYVELMAGLLRDAEATIEKCGLQNPGDIRLLGLRAHLFEKLNQPEEALALSNAAAQLQRTWVGWYEHAKLARRHGEIETALKALKSLLALDQDNTYGLQLLALIELTNGDPDRAAELYEQYERNVETPDSSALVNLGLARILLGDYDGAAEATERAVKAAPLNYTYVLNLADARLLQGRQEEARTLYLRVLELSNNEPGEADWRRLTNRAQAFAHLDRREEAVSEIQGALRLAPENSGDAAYEMALVYALVGDHTSAAVSARKARERGFQAPNWFRLPWFNAVRRQLQESESTAAREPTAVPDIVMQTRAPG